MTAELDATMPAAAAAILARFGINVVYRQTVGEDYDPATGTVSGGTTTSYAVVMSPPIPVSRDMIATGFASASDSVVYLAGHGLAFEPKIGDSIAMRGKTWRVQSVVSYPSGDQISLWQMSVQAGDS
jgi:hypothetical protein